MEQDVKRLVLEISIGIVLYNAVLALVALVVYPNVSVFLGLLVGMTVALLMFLHMSFTFRKAAEAGEEAKSKRVTALGVIVRSLIYLVLLVIVVWKVPQLNIIAVAMGAMGLKAAAYAQPYIHRIMVKKESEKGE